MSIAAPSFGSRSIVLGLAMAAVACGPATTGIDITLLLPEETTDLERTDNASIVLSPDGTVDTFSTDGLDFALSIELDPDSEARELSLYLAEGETLLAWGTTLPFTLLGAESGLALLVARPGALSAMPNAFDTPDPLALAAPIAERGVAVLASDGGTIVIDTYTYGVASADPLPDPPSPDDGVLVDDPEGGVQRLWAGDGLRISRLDPSTGAWTERDLGDHGIDAARPDALWAIDEAGARVRLVGGGASLDVVDIALDPSATDPVAVAGPALDVARPGAEAIVASIGEPAVTLVFGSAAGDEPVAWWLEGARALGPMAAWTGARCVVVAPAPELAVLCGGGTRDGMPTADAVEVTFDAAGDAAALEHPDLFGGPIADPRWWSDEVAVYAQGGGRMWRVDRADLSVREVASASRRATGGSVTRLPTGFSMLVGGREADDAALSRWLVFAPDPAVAVDDAP